MRTERQQTWQEFIDRHPFGLWIIMGLQVLNLVALVLEIVLTEQGWLPTWMMGIMPALSRNAGIPLLILAAIGSIALIGLWLHQQWGWYLTMLQVGANLATLLYLYFNNTPQYINMAINVALVFYLNQVHVRYDIFQENQSNPRGTS